MGYTQTFITIGPPTVPDVPIDLVLLNVTDITASLSWQAGFNGGSEQLFEIRYQENGQNDYKAINSSFSVRKLDIPQIFFINFFFNFFKGLNMVLFFIVIVDFFYHIQLCTSFSLIKEELKKIKYGFK